MANRIVIEVDPDLKADLYVELARRRTTLKAWFCEQVIELMGEQGSASLAAEPPPPTYSSRNANKRREKS